MSYFFGNINSKYFFYIQYNELFLIGNHPTYQLQMNTYITIFSVHVLTTVLQSMQCKSRAVFNKFAPFCEFTYVIMVYMYVKFRYIYSCTLMKIKIKHLFNITLMTMRVILSKCVHGLYRCCNQSEMNQSSIVLGTERR